jgi:hypothetical protein
VFGEQIAVVSCAVLAALIGMDQCLIGFHLAIAKSPVKGHDYQSGIHARMHFQPTTRRLYRSIQTARYRHPAEVRMVVMSTAKKRLGAGGLNSCWSRFSTTPVAPQLALEQGLNALRVLALSWTRRMSLATRWRPTCRPEACSSWWIRGDQ